MRKRQVKKNAKKAGTYTVSFYKFSQRMCRRIATNYGLRGYRLRGPDMVAAFVNKQDMQPYLPYFHWTDPP